MFIKKFLERKLDKEDKKFIAPHFPAGVIKLAQLRELVNLLEQFPESKIKLTGEIVIGGITEEVRNEEFRKKLPVSTFSVAGFSIRPVKVCGGGTICDNNLQDSHSLGLKLDKIFSGRKLPFKMIISVSGCGRCCSEPLVRDIGIVSEKKGYSIFVGGAAGSKPGTAQKLIKAVKEDEVIEIVDKIVELYRKKGKTPERLRIFIEKIGFERFKEIILGEN